MINDQHKYIFVHIPKTGGTSIEAALSDGQASLKKFYSVSDQPVPLLDENGNPYKHAKITDFPNELRNEYFTFSFVRNPWDRAVSRYHWEKQNSWKSVAKDSSFEGFLLAREHLPLSQWNLSGETPDRYATQSSYLKDEHDQIAMDYIGKFEQLKAHFQIVTNRIGLGSLALPHVFRTAKEAFQKYYSKRTQAVVNRAYQEDIDRFGYTFE